MKADWQHDGAQNYDYEYKGVVTYVEEDAHFMVIKDDGREMSWYPLVSFAQETIDPDNGWEIIGNIYENPEMIR